MGKYAKLINSVDTLAAEGFDAFPDPVGKWTTWFDECDEIAASRRLIDLGVITPAQQKLIQGVLSAMRKKEHKFGLSHGDLDPRNVIVGRDGTINLIDWCCSMVCLVPHVDLYNILRETDPDGPDMAAYLEGYGMSRDEFVAVLPEVRAFGLIQQLKRLRWSLAERPDLVVGDTADLRRTVERHLSSMASVGQHPRLVLFDRP